MTKCVALILAVVTFAGCATHHPKHPPLPPEPKHKKHHKPPPPALPQVSIPRPFGLTEGFVITGFVVADGQATISFSGNGTNAAQAQMSADLGRRHGKGKSVTWRDVGPASLISPIVVPVVGNEPSVFFRLRLVKNTPPVSCGPPPVVQILSPASGATVSDVFTFTGSAYDQCGVTNVQFYVDNLGSWLLQSSQPGAGVSNVYSTPVGSSLLANGGHNALFRAYDQNGQSSYSYQAMTVTNFNGDPGTQKSFTDIAAGGNVSALAQSVSVAFDSKGSAVIGGKFQGRVNITGTTTTAVGGYDIWLEKINPSGAASWVKSWGGPYDQMLSSVAVAPDDSIWITGQSVGTFSLGGGNLISGGGNNNPDPFVGHFSGNGDHLLSWRFGGPSGNQANGIATDKDGNIYVCGNFNAFCDFGAGFVSGSGGAGFVASWTPNGVLRWSAIQDGDGFDAAEFVAVDGGAVYLVGSTGSSAIDFGKGAVANSGNSMWVAKYTTINGSLLWARVFATAPNGYSDGGGLAIGPDGSVLVDGVVTGTLSIDGQTVNATSSSAMMVCKLKPDGNLIWLRQFGGTSSVGGNVSARFLCSDANGCVITSGTVTGEADFGNGQIGAGTGNYFVQKLSKSGGYLWHRRAGGGAPCGGLGVATDASRNVGQVGYVSGSMSIDGQTVSSPSIQTSDGFLRITSP